MSTANGAPAARSTARRTSAIAALTPISLRQARHRRPLSFRRSPPTDRRDAAPPAASSEALAKIVRRANRSSGRPARRPSGRHNAPGTADSRRSSQRCGAIAIPAASTRSAIARSIRPPSDVTTRHPPPSTAPNAAARRRGPGCESAGTRPRATPSSSEVWHKSRMPTMSSTIGSRGPGASRPGETGTHRRAPRPGRRRRVARQSSWTEDAEASRSAGDRIAL